MSLQTQGQGTVHGVTLRWHHTRAHQSTEPGRQSLAYAAGYYQGKRVSRVYGTGQGFELVQGPLQQPCSVRVGSLVRKNQGREAGVLPLPCGTAPGQQRLGCATSGLQHC